MLQLQSKSIVHHCQRWPGLGRPHALVHGSSAPVVILPVIITRPLGMQDLISLIFDDGMFTTALKDLESASLSLLERTLAPQSSICWFLSEIST